MNLLENINTQSEFSFDEVISKTNGIESVNLKNSYLKFNVNNFPIKKLDELAKNLTEQNYEEYFKSFAQSGITLQSTGNASNYMIGNQKIFETLKFDLALANPIVYSHGEYYGLGKKLGTFGYSIRKQRKKRQKK